MTDEQIKKLSEEYAEWELDVLPAGLKKLTTISDRLEYSTPAYHAFKWLSETHCIVEKSKVKEWAEESRYSVFDSIDLIEIFNDLFGKETFNDNKQ